MKIKKGDKIPSVDLFYLDENKAVKKIEANLLFENQKVILFGLPGAFTSVCSAKHLPGFVNNFDLAKKKGINKIICISVNDPFVMNAWGEKHYNGVHWYPRISVYDAKFGWTRDQHLGKEFYGDFGCFDVELTFPSNYIVARTARFSVAGIVPLRLQGPSCQKPNKPRGHQHRL